MRILEIQSVLMKMLKVNILSYFGQTRVDPATMSRGSLGSCDPGAGAISVMRSTKSSRVQLLGGINSREVAIKFTFSIGFCQLIKFREWSLEF